jgi:hypothetical protein
MTVGKEYVVLGLSLSSGDPNINLWIKDDPGNYFVSTPQDLFEVIESRVSRHWEVKIDSTGTAIGPKEFLKPLFLDKLTNLEERQVTLFRSVTALLEQEAMEHDQER